MIRSKRTSEKHHQNTEMYEAFEKNLIFLYHMQRTRSGTLKAGAKFKNDLRNLFYGIFKNFFLIL